MLIGYGRVSSTGQNLDTKIDAIKKIGCEKIFMVKKSGTSTNIMSSLNQATTSYFLNSF